MTVLGPSYIRSHKLLSAIVTLPENISVQVYNMCTLENLENSSYVALIVGTRPDFRDFFLKKNFFLSLAVGSARELPHVVNDCI